MLIQTISNYHTGWLCKTVNRLFNQQIHRFAEYNFLTLLAQPDVILEGFAKPGFLIKIKARGILDQLQKLGSTFLILICEIAGCQPPGGPKTRTGGFTLNPAGGWLSAIAKGKKLFTPDSLK